MNTMNSYIHSRRDRRPGVSLRTNKKAPECILRFRGHDKIKKGNDIAVGPNAINNYG